MRSVKTSDAWLCIWSNKMEDNQMMSYQWFFSTETNITADAGAYMHHIQQKLKLVFGVELK